MLVRQGQPLTFDLAAVGGRRPGALIDLVLLLDELVAADEVPRLRTECAGLGLESVVVVALGLLLLHCRIALLVLLLEFVDRATVAVHSTISKTDIRVRRRWVGVGVRNLNSISISN